MVKGFGDFIEEAKATGPIRISVSYSCFPVGDPYSPATLAPSTEDSSPSGSWCSPAPVSAPNPFIARKQQARSRTVSELGNKELEVPADKSKAPLVLGDPEPLLRLPKPAARVFTGWNFFHPAPLLS